MEDAGGGVLKALFEVFRGLTRGVELAVNVPVLIEPEVIMPRRMDTDTSSRFDRRLAIRRLE